jgi:glutamate synthase domain-containing protein 3
MSHEEQAARAPVAARALGEIAQFKADLYRHLVDVQVQRDLTWLVENWDEFNAKFAQLWPRALDYWLIDRTRELAAAVAQAVPDSPCNSSPN